MVDAFMHVTFPFDDLFLPFLYLNTHLTLFLSLNLNSFSNY